MQELLIESIRTDGGVQSRERINDEYVMELAELIKTGKKLPPIDVYNSGGGEVWAADGFHRILAHIKAEKRTIRCNVHKGSKADAIWASCAANQSHGLRRTNADKRHAVEMALKSKGSLSDQAIADHVGVHVNTVNSARRQGTQIVGPDRRVGVDGKTYRVPPPPSAPRMPPPPPQGDTTRRIPPPPSGNRIPPPPCLPTHSMVGTTPEDDRPRATDKPERLDEVGKPIPDHLWPLWDRGAEIAEMAATVTRLAGLIRRMHDEGDLVILDGNGQAIVAALETAKQGLKANIPHAVCPYCKGTFSDRCRFCKGRGIVGDFAYKHVPGELKA